LKIVKRELRLSFALQVDVADDAGGTEADWWTTTASLKAATGGDGGSKATAESSLLAAFQARLDELEKRVSASEQHTIAQQQSEPSHGEQAARKQQLEAGAQAGDSTAAAEVEPQGTQVSVAPCLTCLEPALPHVLENMLCRCDHATDIAAGL
jgi:hypothetical protein